MLKPDLAGTYTVAYQVANAPTGGKADGLVAGPDGNLWFTNVQANLIQRLGLTGGVVEYPLQAGAAPTHIVVGPDGNLWFTESGTGSIGRISTAGALTEYGASSNITAGSIPTGITVGPDGNIWFAENGANKIAKFVL